MKTEEFFCQFILLRMKGERKKRKKKLKGSSSRVQGSERREALNEGLFALEAT